MGNIMPLSLRLMDTRLFTDICMQKLLLQLLTTKPTGPQALASQVHYLQILIRRGHLLVSKISVGTKHQTNSLTKLQYQTKNPLRARHIWKLLLPPLNKWKNKQTAKNPHKKNQNKIKRHTTAKFYDSKYVLSKTQLTLNRQNHNGTLVIFTEGKAFCLNLTFYYQQVHRKQRQIARLFQKDHQVYKVKWKRNNTPIYETATGKSRSVCHHLYLNIYTSNCISS